MQQLQLDYEPSSKRMDFLILGSPRSGTSLMAGLLNEHPEVAVGFELFGVTYSLFPGSPRSRCKLFLALCDSAASRSELRMWGNKITTDPLRYGYNDDPKGTLGQITDVFGDTPVVFMVRDGRAVLHSRMMHEDVPPDVAANLWNFSIELFKNWQTRRNVHLVRFDNLISDPGGTMSNVCSFLKIELTDGMLNTKAELIPDRFRKPCFDESKLWVPDYVPPAIEENLKAMGFIE